MMRILLAPLILTLSALSFTRLEADRRANCYGWIASEMKAHWQRLRNWKSYGDFDHSAKNVLSEWVRLDPQRAGKMFAFMLIASVMLNVIQCIL